MLVQTRVKANIGIQNFIVYTTLDSSSQFATDCIELIMGSEHDAPIDSWVIFPNSGYTDGLFGPTNTAHFHELYIGQSG